MAITLETVARNAALDGVDALANGGSVDIRAGGAVLVTIPLEATAFEPAGTPGAGQARAIGGDGVNPVSVGNPLTNNGAVAGAADNYQVISSGAALLWSGVASATGGGGDMELDNVNVVVGQAVNIIGWTRNQPA